MTYEPEGGYRCLDCGAEFSSAEAMNAHIDVEHNEGYGTEGDHP